MRKTDVPWEIIKNEYITTDTSYAILAKKYGLHRTTVGNRAVREKWVELRGQHRDETRIKIEEAARAEAQERGLAALRRVGRIAELALDRAEELLGEPGGLNGTQLEAAVGALRSAAAIVRDVYGLLTEAERRRLELDREKLEIDRARAARADEGADGLRIVIDAPEGMDA